MFALVALLVLTAPSFAFGGKSDGGPRGNGSLIPGPPSITLGDCEFVEMREQQIYVRRLDSLIAIAEYKDVCAGAEVKLAQAFSIYAGAEVTRANAEFVRSPEFREGQLGLMNSLGAAVENGTELTADMDRDTGKVTHVATGRIGAYQAVQGMYEAMAQANTGYAPSLPAPTGILPGASGFQSAIVNRQVVADRFSGGGGLFSGYGSSYGGGLFPEIPNFYEAEQRSTNDLATCAGNLATCQGQVQRLDEALTEVASE